jgi:hypothetical protein
MALANPWLFRVDGRIGDARGRGLRDHQILPRIHRPLQLRSTGTGKGALPM